MARRGPDGRLLRRGWGQRNAITGEFRNERDCSILHNPWPGSPPVANDWSGPSTPADMIAANYGGRPHTHPGTQGYCQRQDCYGPAFGMAVAEEGQDV